MWKWEDLWFEDFSYIEGKQHCRSKDQRKKYQLHSLQQTLTNASRLDNWKKAIYVTIPNYLIQQIQLLAVIPPLLRAPKSMQGHFCRGSMTLRNQSIFSFSLSLRWVEAPLGLWDWKEQSPLSIVHWHWEGLLSRKYEFRLNSFLQAQLGEDKENISPFFLQSIILKWASKYKAKMLKVLPWAYCCPGGWAQFSSCCIPPNVSDTIWYLPLLFQYQEIEPSPWASAGGVKGWAFLCLVVPQISYSCGRPKIKTRCFQKCYTTPGSSLVKEEQQL